MSHRCVSDRSGGGPGLRRRRLSRSDGYLAVLVMVVLCWLGALAGMRALVVANAALVSRAYDVARQDAAWRTRMGRVAAEAVLACVETGRASSQRGAAAEARARLDEIDAGGIRTVLVSAPDSLRTDPPYPSNLSRPRALVSPAVQLAASMDVQLASLAGSRVLVTDAGVWEFSGDRPVLGVQRTLRARFRASVVDVPLTRFAVMAYEYPAEISRLSAPVTGPAASLAERLAEGRDPWRNRSLHADGALPYHYRRLSSLANAYQYLFSQAFADRAALEAGATLRCDLDQAETQTAKLDGLERTDWGARWDLGLAGGGSFAGVSSSGALVLVSTNREGVRLEWH